MSLMERARDLWGRVTTGARAYRFDGEQANHAQQLAETQAAIAGFERVEANPEATPEERHWLNQHRAGMEDRLAVFETKPRLTVEEMNERDAIETHLYGAPLPRQGRNVLVRREGGETGPKRLLGAVAASPALAILLSPWTWLIASLALVGIQTARIGNLKDDVREARTETQRAVEERDAWKERTERYAQAVADARQIATETADALEAERARAARAAARERRRQREIQDVITGSSEPPAWSLRDDEPVSPGPAPGH